MCRLVHSAFLCRMTGFPFSMKQWGPAIAQLPSMGPVQDNRRNLTGTKALWSEIYNDETVLPPNSVEDSVQSCISKGEGARHTVQPLQAQVGTMDGLGVSSRDNKRFNPVEFEAPVARVPEIRSQVLCGPDGRDTGRSLRRTDAASDGPEQQPRADGPEPGR